VEGPAVDRGEEILTPQAPAFVADLQSRLGAHRDALLAARATRQAEIATARRIGFRPETAAVRDGDWQVPPPPPGLVDARALFEQVALAEEFPDLRTLPAYELID
jgi:malate synthase